MEGFAEAWAAEFRKSCVFLLQAVPEQWENCVLGRMPTVVAKQGRTRRRVAMVFDEKVWKVERQHEGEDWLQVVLRHREPAQAIEIVHVHLAHKQCELEIFARPLTEIRAPSMTRRVVGGDFNEDGWDCTTEKRTALESFLKRWGVAHLLEQVPRDWTHEQWGTEIRRRLYFVLGCEMADMKWSVAQHVPNRSDHNPTILCAKVGGKRCARNEDTRRVARGWLPYCAR